MRIGLTYLQMPSSTGGVHGGRYTLEQLAQNPTYASVVRQIDSLEGTYADGARMFLPPAIEAAETMLSPEQTAQLCNDTFACIDSAAFQAFEKYPAIFRAARGRLKPNHIFTILEKLTKRTRSTLPFHGLAKTIEGMEGVSSKGIAELISTGIHADGFLTCRSMDRLAPAYIVSRLRFASEQDTIGFFRLMKKRFGTRADKVSRAMPALLSGIDDTYTHEQIVDAITRPKIPGFSPTANAIVALYKIVLFKQGESDPDVKVEELIAELRAEGDTALRNDLPTMGGKISGARSDFNETFFDYLDMLGFECREDIFFRSWSEVSATTHAMLVLPGARSAFETSLLIDMLRDVGVFRDGAILRHHISVAGKLSEDVKYIELALHSAKPIRTPYPELLMSPISGFVHLAPVVEGGWTMTDINKKGPWFKYRFDFALMSIYVLVDEHRVLRQAMERSYDDQSLMELVLGGMYKMSEAKRKREVEDVEPAGASDESDLVKIDKGVGNVTFFVRQSVDPEIAKEYIEELEGPYGKDLEDLRNFHEFSIRATQLLSWAMHSPYLSDQRSVFRYFMLRMHNLYRKEEFESKVELESTLKTKWKRRRWKQIYPSLRQLDAIKKPEFHRAVRDLVEETVQKLQKMVK